MPLEVSTTDLTLALALSQLPLTVAGWTIVRRVPRFFGPADWVSLLRAGGACGCAFLVMLSVLGSFPHRSWALVAVAVPTLLLDGVDGWVARRTDTASAAGASLDMELDAAVLVILAVGTALTLGPWVLMIGAFRYLYAVTGWLWPWLATPLPRSQFRRVVAGIQGAALTVALAPTTPPRLASYVVGSALVLLVASFAQQAVLARKLHRWGVSGAPGAPQTPR